MRNLVANRRRWPRAAWFTREPRIQVVFTLALVVAGILNLPATGLAYLDQLGYSPAPDQFLPEEVFSQFGADLSFVWPLDVDPTAPSSVCGVSNGELVARDILEKGSRGVRTILHLGFVVGNSFSPTPERDRRTLVQKWAQVLRREGALRYVHSVLGIDDSNCLNLIDPGAGAFRRRATGWLTSAFPGRPVGHVLNIAGWGEGRWSGSCGPIGPENFGFPGETIVFAYDYRVDGTSSCPHLGQAPSADPAANSSLVIADLEAMLATLQRTQTRLRPVIFIAKGYQAVTCEPDPVRNLVISCHLSDLWARLEEPPPASSPLRKLVAFVPFAWHDVCGPSYFWTGFERSPWLRAAGRWIASRR